MKKHDSRRRPGRGLFIIPLVTWVLHLVICFIAITFYCSGAAVVDDSVDPVAEFIAVVTVVAVMLIAKTAASGYKRMQTQAMETAPSALMRTDDRRFRVLLILVYLSSALATLVVAALTYLIAGCG